MGALADVRAKHPEYNDLSDQQLADGLYKKFYSDMPRAEFDQKVGLQQPQGGSIIDPIMHGLLPFADEAAGVVGGVVGAVTGDGFEKGYTDTVTKARANYDAYKERHPDISTAAEIAGAIPTALVPVGAAAKGATMMAKVGRGALGGGTLGALYGAGEGEGGEDRIRQGAIGLITGGVAGGLAAPIGAAVGLGAKGVMQGARKIAGKGASTADKQIAEAIAADAADPASVAALGPEGMVLDTGPNARQMAQAVAVRPGEGQSIVRKAVADRKAGASQRIDDAITNAFGAKVNLGDLITDQIAKRKQLADPIYEAAKREPIQVTPEIQAVLDTPAGKAATARAKVMSKNEGITWQPDVRGLDMIKKAFDDTIEYGKRQTRGANGVRIITKLKDDLVTAMDDQVPLYKQARAAFESESEIKDALIEGRKIFSNNLHPQELDRMLTSMSPAAKDAYLQGARAAIADTMATAKNDALAARTLFDKGFNRDKTALVLGHKQADDLFQKLSAETKFSHTATKVLDNSETASRLMGQGPIGQGKVAQAAETGANAYVNGGFFGPFRAGVVGLTRSLIRAVSGGAQDKVITEIAKRLTASGAQRDEVLNAARLLLSRQKSDAALASKVSDVVTKALDVGNRATAVVPAKREPLKVWVGAPSPGYQ
jgi:hypothetical protein